MALRSRAQKVTISGQDKVIKLLNQQIQAMRGRNRAGMTEAALLVRRESMLGTPVQTSNLKSGHRTDVSEDSRGINAVIGTGQTDDTTVSASYAVFVHENLDAHHKVGRARFLALALVENARQILEIIKRHARIK